MFFIYQKEASHLCLGVDCLLPYFCTFYPPNKLNSTHLCLGVEGQEDTLGGGEGTARPVFHLRASLYFVFIFLFVFHLHVFVFHLCAMLYFVFVLVFYLCAI